MNGTAKPERKNIGESAGNGLKLFADFVGYDKLRQQNYAKR